MSKTNCMGIIAEYNPFHNGHAYQLAEAKAQLGDLPVIAVMSGNFTQRGLPAVADKWQRAEIAVKNGIDLVIELPTIFACRSAQYFATGAVSLLHNTGIVSHIVFGAENANLTALAATAKQMLTSPALLRQELKRGLSYPAALAASLDDNTAFNQNLSTAPNNILALEYLKALKTLKSSIVPVPIQRTGTMYHDLHNNNGFASATAIRNYLLHNDWAMISQVVSPQTLCTLKNLAATKLLGYDPDKLNLLLAYHLRQLSPEIIQQWSECSEGLENKIKQAANSVSWQTAVQTIKSKRYPEARINRILLQLLLSSPSLNFKEALLNEPQYIRILAFNLRGRALLKKMKKKSKLPIITKLGRQALSVEREKAYLKSLKIDLSASDLYGIIQQSPQRYAKDFYMKPYYLEE